jgi:hypothetical protein
MRSTKVFLVEVFIIFSLIFRTIFFFSNSYLLYYDALRLTYLLLATHSHLYYVT